MTDKQPSLEQDLAELESLIKSMESGDTHLELALSNYEKGIKLIKQCQSALNHAEQTVKVLTENQLQDFKNDGNNDRT